MREFPILRSKDGSFMPGDETRELTHTAKDERGFVWVPGTQFKRLSFGHCNQKDDSYQCVSIKGRRVVFYAKQNGKR